MDLKDLNMKLIIARERGFIFMHINKLTITIYSHRRNINISYNPKHRIQTLHRTFFEVISQNLEHVFYFCNDFHNTFQFT